MSRFLKHARSLLLASCLLFLPLSAAAASQPRDADSNAVVYNGAYSRNELVQKLRNGDGHNSASSLQQEFRSRGITIQSILSDNTVNGTVTKGGRVVVDGKTVATGAISYGRINMAGSTKEGNLYARPTSVSFQSASLPAFVHFEKGRFKYAIIKSCGNMVKATAVPAKTTKQPAAAPQPQPQPVVIVQQTQVQTQTQTQAAPSAPTPTPAAAAPKPAPQQLPQTGAGAMALFGTTAISGALWQYRRSRENLAAAQRQN